MLKQIIRYLGGAFSFMKKPWLARLIRSCRIHFESGMYKSVFKEFGDNSVLAHPRVIEGANCICIGDSCSILEGIVLTAIENWQGLSYTPQILIGSNCCIGRLCHITCINKVIIKDNVLIGAEVTITDHNHGGVEKTNRSFLP